MKNALIALLAISTVALGALCLNQRTTLEHESVQLAETQKQLAALQAEMKANSEAIDQAKFSQTKVNTLQKTLTETAASAAEQSKKAEQLQESLAAAKTNNPMRAMSEMFKDPKMREMMKSQQKMVLGPMMEKQYAALFQQLNLTPEQSSALKDLLMKKALAGADAGFSMLDDSLDSSQRADLMKQVKDQTTAFDSQIKDFLGQDNYTALQAYEKSVPDRMTVSQFGDQLSGEVALNADQQAQLTQALSEARNAFHWTADLNQRSGNNADMLSQLTEDNITRFSEERAQFDEQFLVRAAQILNQQQLAAFQEFLKSQRQLQITGLKMASHMFGGTKN